MFSQYIGNGIFSTCMGDRVCSYYNRTDTFASNICGTCPHDCDNKDLFKPSLRKPDKTYIFKRRYLLEYTEEVVVSDEQFGSAREQFMNRADKLPLESFETVDDGFTYFEV